MTDIKIMIEATRQLKQAWESTCCDVKGEAITNELYDALCEVDREGWRCNQNYCDWLYQ